MAGLNPADVAPFLARLTRLERDTVVRLRPAGTGTVALWGRVPWGVLVTRTVPGPVLPDTTVGAAALLHALTEGDRSLPPARDADWRWAVPPRSSRAVEELPAAELRRVGTAAAETLRAARGRIGERILRDALLDHVPIVVTAEGEKIEIRQGLVQAMLRMAFMSTNEGAQVTVRVAGTWVGLTADFGATWVQNGAGLAIQVAK
jgi:hypothetical protein